MSGLRHDDSRQDSDILGIRTEWLLSGSSARAMEYCTTARSLSYHRILYNDSNALLQMRFAFTMHLTVVVLQYNCNHGHAQNFAVGKEQMLVSASIFR